MVKTIKGVLFNVSYTDPEVTLAINAIVGNKFPLRKRFSMGGTGSQRFKVVAANDTLWQVISPTIKLPFSNIELRPKGLKIWFNIKLHTYILALSYLDLQITVQQDQLQLNTTTFWLHLKPAHNASLNRKFIEKAERLKQEYLKHK